MVRRISYAAFVIAAFILSCSCHGAEVFQWSPPAPHHAAVVRVTVSSGGMSAIGSGCYVDVGGVKGVLTANHVVSDPGKVQVHWSDGTQTTGTVTGDATGADLAMILTEHATVQPLTMADRPPQPGEWVELCGYGGAGAGSTARLRHWWGTLNDTRAWDGRGNAYADYHCAVIQGDSGGTVLDTSHRVVGVIASGKGEPIASVGGAMAFSGTGGPAYDVVYQFTSRVSRRFGVGIGIFGGSSCGPSGCGPAYGGGNNGWAYPPQAQQPRPVPRPQPVPQPAPPMVEIDYAKIADQLAKDDRFRGPAGPPGPAGSGPPGPQGPPGPGPTEAQIFASVEAWVDANPDKLAELIAPKLPPIYFRKIDASTGKEITAPEPVQLGEGFTFYLHPQ